MARTNIAVDEAVAQSLADEATKENKSLYALTNEALSAVLTICRYGGVPREVYPSWRFSRILKDTDAIPLPGDVLEKLMKRAYANDREWLLKEWFDQGARIGAYLHMYAQNFLDLESRVNELQGLLPVKRVEFERKEESGKNVLIVRVIGAGLSNETTKCTAQFLLGILSAYHYEIVEDSVSEGIIEVWAQEGKGKQAT